jgi:hypothetical protein
MAEVLVDLLQGGHYAFLEELPIRYMRMDYSKREETYKSMKPEYK